MDSDTYILTIPITNDDICEDTESFNITINNIVSGYLGSQCWMCVEIKDDESTTYALNVASATVSESDRPFPIPVQRTGMGVMQQGTAALTFRDITATSNDYSSTSQSLIFPPSSPTSANTQTSYVNIVDDNCYENSESFTVDISSVEPSQCSSIGTGPSAQSVKITIEDNDSKFKWNVENDNIMLKEGEPSSQIHITRQGTLRAKNVEFYVDHITTIDDDIRITPSYGEVTFAAGSASTQPVTISAQDDDEIEDDESFTLTLVDPLGSACPNKNRGEPYKLYIQIRDNDAKYYWKESSLSVGENEGQVHVCLVRTGDINTSRTVAISFDSVTAYSGLDFLPVTNIVFDTESEICVPVTIFDNDNIESAKTFTISIEPRQDNIVVGSPGVVTVTITDDDTAIVGWDQVSYTFVEGSSASAIIGKMGVSAVTLTVTSTSGLYTPLSQSIYMSASDDSYSLLLSIPDDDILETDRIFTLTLTAPSSVTITQGTTTVTITDNDMESPPSENRGIGGGAIAGITIAGIIAIISTIIAIAIAIRLSRRYGSAKHACVSEANDAYGTNSAPLGYVNGGAYYVT
ncbi:extracellular matrix organizing protein FRAS1-like [Amphiura filiformis]|uniref:extracellular matrix organizing protein FRAS1-like n=1 Tax=Amphiura filiformis TaxID=82378 RepID=UPI003B21330B